MTDPPGPSYRPADPEPPASAEPVAPSEPAGRGVALMLALAAVLAAAVATRASFLSSEAAGLWQSAIRNELKLGAAMVEDVRFVYNDEGPQAFRIAAARVRAEEYRRRARNAAPDVARVLRVEATAQQLVADSLVESSDIAKEEKYETEDGGFDLARRLADNRARNPDLVAIDADAIQAEGDDLAARAVLMLSTAVPVGVAFLLGALAQAYRRRRALLTAGYVVLGLSLVLAVVVEVSG